jgi:hypothetical protein
LISTSSVLGSAPWKLAQIVVDCSPACRGVPDELGLLDVADAVGGLRPVVDDLRTGLGRGDSLGRADLVEAQAVEVDVAEVLVGGALGIDDPVAGDLLGVRVEVAEEGVGDGHLPHRAAVRLPAGDPLRALDDDVLALGGLVGDAARVAEAAAAGLHPLAVLPRVHDHGVARPGEGGGPIDRTEGLVLASGVGVRAGGRHVEHGGHLRMPFDERDSGLTLQR